MPLLRSSNRPTPVQCFFCLSPSLLPPHPSASSPIRDIKGKSRIAEIGTKWNWQCDRCGCWNIRDERGEMISDLPAMHDTAYNDRSFSLRAKPSSSHLPSSSSTSPFCHSCLANQTLIMNMLANYLPDDEDHSYPMLYAELPNYLTKLHSRYPPVCRSCQPAVDEILKKSDHRAQVEAWGSALNRGFRTSDTHADSSKRDMNTVGKGDIITWSLRGALWWTGLGLNWGHGLLATMKPARLERMFHSDIPLLPSTSILLLGFNISSILWIAWDPYWLKRARGRSKVKVEGRDIWVRNMVLIMILRIAQNSLICYDSFGKLSRSWIITMIQMGFALEVTLLLHSLMSIRISQPVPISLVRPVSISSSPAPHHPTYVIPPHPSSPAAFSSSSLSHPSCQATRPMQVNPIFGQASLHQPLPISSIDGEPMDWEPSLSTRQPLLSPEYEDDYFFRENGKENWDKFGMGKQRMFHNQDETGLENLLAGWDIGENKNINSQSNQSRNVTVKHQTDSQGMRILIRRLGIGFVIIRVLGLAFTLVTLKPNYDLPSASPLTGSGKYVKVISQYISILEIVLSVVRLPTIINLNGGILSALILQSAWSAIDIVARSAMVFPSSKGSNVSLTKSFLHDTDSLEWLLWGTMDAIGVAVQS
ncbi:uncharacterized protein IL334_007628 [Kwoniella shivajii]|uniref:Ima1 N-terminal domain-containing protein n=1 Tax=Kwoniella shivajii TaxID=564305 RepID=A0ABZ1D963_9TREE|nr:hypothetical protein IL334_007628 [Kwoniella shivajii]